MSDILEAREVRSEHVQELMKANEYKTIAVLKLNVVGGNKNPINMRFICNLFDTYIRDEFKEKIIESRKVRSLDGDYIYYVIDEVGNVVKERTMIIEDENYLGRLIDIDVYNTKSISREDMQCEMRTCLVCNNYAHICSRNQTHSKEEIYSVVNTLIEIHLTDYILNITMQSIFEELDMYPRFGLVSHRDSGSHSDMDYELFVNSSFILKPHIKEYILYGVRGIDYPLELQKIGQRAERDMFIETKGINTQKGLIYALGLFLPAVTKAIINNRNSEYIQSEITRISREIQADYYETLSSKENPSHGDKIFLEHGLKGIRGESLNGFKILFDIDGFYELDNDERNMEYLIHLMSKLDDTTIIHKVGIETLREVQNDMLKIIDNGGYSKNKDLINIISETYKKRNISPGGCSDLLVLKIIFEQLKYLICLECVS